MTTAMAGGGHCRRHVQFTRKFRFSAQVSDRIRWGGVAGCLPLETVGRAFEIARLRGSLLRPGSSRSPEEGGVGE